MLVSKRTNGAPAVAGGASSVCRESMRSHLPLAAAAVNGAVVLLLPAGLVLLSSVLRTTLPAHFTSGAVHAPAVSTVVNAIQTSLIGLIVTMPLAGIAAWRTWVYALGWLDRRRSWRGVVEAAALGGLLVGGMLGSAALGAAVHGAGSIWVVPAITLYASIGALVGLFVGLILQVTAMAVLRIGPRFRG